ncbi:DUF2637 domain-containing protein [Streptomyces sp. NPDC057217]|uniref:DUF2637 domain-containing protein n=1 Tax=Streptomyces sp. NPDC057217 TaxID=3346054 RepID=UPI00363A9306
MLSLRSLRDPIFIQAVIAAALSLSHIHDVAEAAGQAGWKAWAYPISVDVLLAVSWKLMRTRGGVAAWSWFLVAMTASLGANIVTSGVMDLEHPPAALRVIVAGWPAVAFLGGTLLVHRHRDEGVDEVAEPPAEEPQEPAQEPVDEALEEVVDEVPEEPEEADLVSYAVVAAELDVEPVTVRGWAVRGLIKRYPGPVTGRVRVSMAECRQYRASQTVKA